MSTHDHNFSNLHNFLHFVVLPNCVEYFDALDEDANDVTRREEHRRLFNAVIGLQSAVDHAFHAAEAGATEAAFKRSLIEKEPALEKVLEIANALKHCMRDDRTKLDANEVAAVYVWVADGEVGFRAVDLAGAQEAVKAAFTFWLSYAPQRTKG